MPPKAAKAAKAANTALPEAIASAALEQLERSDLRQTIIQLVAERVIASMHLDQLAEAVAEEHGAEVGKLIVRDILRTQPI